MDEDDQVLHCPQRGSPPGLSLWEPWPGVGGGAEQGEYEAVPTCGH